MAKNCKRASKIRSLTVGLLNLLKEITTCLFSVVIGILNLVGIIVE